MKKFTVFKVISIVLSVAVAVLMAIMLSDMIKDINASAENGMNGFGAAIGFLLGIVYIGGIGGGAAFLFATIGLICTLAKCPKVERKGQVITFVILMIIPFVLERLFYLISILIM